jgi:hypothetical protein
VGLFLHHPSIGNPHPKLARFQPGKHGAGETASEIGPPISTPPSSAGHQRWRRTLTLLQIDESSPQDELRLLRRRLADIRQKDLIGKQRD